MKDSAKIILALIVGLTIVGVALIFSQKDSTPSEIDIIKKTMLEEAGDTEEIFTDEIKDEFRVEFIEGCSEGVSSEYAECACLHDEILKDLKFEGFFDLALKIFQSEELNDKEAQAVIDSVDFCTK